MTQSQPAKITDIPLSQLMPLHAMRSVTVDDVRNALSPEFAQFAEQIAAVFSGENVEHPELFARNLNPEPQAEVTGKLYPVRDFGDQRYEPPQRITSATEAQKSV
ncbi:TPA: hypothetical protein I8W00_001176 [Corynebacterium striatum]|nr:hypothetical protein [Corynebacterium striatum]